VPFSPQWKLAIKTVCASQIINSGFKGLAPNFVLKLSSLLSCIYTGDAAVENANVDNVKCYNFPQLPPIGSVFLVVIGSLKLYLAVKHRQCKWAFDRVTSVVISMYLDGEQCQGK
jgi:hypothetical protein